jgi:hypothetical protein
MKSNLLSWWVGLLLGCLFALSGCGAKGNPELKVAPLGSFYVNRAGTSLEGQFTIPSAATQSLLGFTLRSSIGAADTTQIMLTQSNLASGKLRLHIQLRETNAPGPFYETEFCLGRDGRLENYIYLGVDHWETPGFQYVFTAVEPLSDPRSTNLNRPITAAYPFGREKFPLRHGTLLPNIGCKVKLRVLDPVPITNEFQLWLYSICDPRERAQE